MRETLKAEVEKIGVTLSEDELNKFQIFHDALLEYNAVMNLTAIKDEYEIIVKHYVDSLTLGETGFLKDGASVIDIGAGAGFPSVPNAIVHKNVRFTMLDSLNKRVSFLNEVISRTGLENASAIHQRAEDAGRNKLYREKFDVAAARAVADLAVLSEYALPFVRVGGVFLAMKGTAPDGEIRNAKKAVSLLGGKIEDVREVKIDSLNLNHTIAVVRKIKETASKYPRKAGTPSKNPL